MVTTARSEHYLGVMAISTSPPKRSGPSTGAAAAARTAAKKKARDLVEDAT